jgi:hypothetical protein
LLSSDGWGEVKMQQLQALGCGRCCTEADAWYWEGLIV